METRPKYQDLLSRRQDHGLRRTGTRTQTPQLPDAGSASPLHLPRCESSIQRPPRNPHATGPHSRLYPITPPPGHRNHRSVSNFRLSPQPLSIYRRARCLVRPWPLAWRGGALDVMGVSPWFPVSLTIPPLLLPRTFWPAHFHFNPRGPRPIHARCSSIHAHTLQVSSTTLAAPTSNVA